MAKQEKQAVEMPAAPVARNTASGQADVYRATRKVVINGHAFGVGEEVCRISCHPDVTFGDLVSAVRMGHVTK